MPRRATSHPGGLRIAARALWLLIAVVLTLVALPGTALGAGFARATSDRPDDFKGRQIHIVYALPSDGTDASLDTSGAIADSVAAFQRWMLGQTPNRRLRIDTSGGQIDVTFFRLAKTNAQIGATGSRAVDEMASEMTQAGITRPGKIYGIYYDGGDNAACASGQLGGLAGALYLHGAPAGSPACDSQQLAAPGADPGYLDMAMLHELMHVQGYIPACAPHETRAGHVSDSPTDLMYAGDQPWDVTHMVLDYGRDDYYQANIPGCLEFSASPYLGPPDGTSGTALTVLRTGLGNGSVTSSPAGVDCGTVCEHSYAGGTAVTLTAAHSPGSGFAGWAGACSGTGPCHVTMSTERQVSASFVLPPNTQIVKLAVSGARHTAGVRFRGVGAGHTRFECKLDSRSFKPCRSPKTFRHLAPGRHSVRVRAVNEAGADKSPAKRTFTIPKPH